MGRDIKLDPRLREMLELSGVPWEIANGSKHAQLRIAGRLVLTLPQSAREVGNTIHNARAALRRHLRQHHGVEV